MKTLILFFTVSGQLMIIGLLFSVSLSAQHLKAKNESIISDKNVTCMASDGMSRLWFGTASEEIFVFSGQSIRKFNHGLQNTLHEISEIGFTNEGKLFGCADQTFFFIDPASDELSSRELKYTINDVIDVGNNAFLVGSTAGLYSINVAERKMEIIEGTSDMMILEIVGDDDLYFIRTNESIHRVLLDKGKWQTEKLDFPFVSPTDIFLDKVGALWIATARKGILKFQHNQWTRLDEFNGLLDDNVQEVYNDDSNSLWVLYDNGFLDIISGNLGKIARLQPGMDITRMTNAILGMDQYGSMWVRNDFGDIQRIYQTPFTEIKDRRGNSYRNNKLLHLKGDQHYGMASGNRFWRHQNGFIQEFSMDDIGNQIITDFQVKNNGEIAATNEDGELLLISRFNNVKLDSSTGIIPGPIDHFICDNQNNIWFAKGDQIGFLNPAGEIRYNTLSTEAVKAIIHDGERGVYVIAGHTLYSCDDGGVKPVKQTKHIGNALLFDVNSNSLFMYDGQKLFWSSLDSGDMEVRLIADTLLLGVHSLHLSEHFAVLVGSNELQCIDLNSGRRKIIHEINENSIFIKSQNSDLSLDGEMWLASNNGIHSFWVRDIIEAQENRRPELTFADIQVSYRSICSDVIPCLETDEYEFPSFENDISFSLEGIDLNPDREISYRWKMEGTREEWSPYSATNEISFTDLNPGSYRVLVMAKNQDSLESYILKSPLIVINPYWWQRPLVKWGAMGLAILILSLIINNRYRKIKRKAAEERDKLILEKKMLQYEQQALQLQLNPHFIFNALNNIQGRLSESDTKTARLQLSKFATLMRQILENSRRPWIPIKDEIATLENYMKIEQYARPELFTWSLDWTDEIDVEEDMIPPMMIQPFIENAIIHGFRSIDYQGHIKVSFSKVAKRILCRIDDNGVGIVKSSIVKKKQNRSVATQVIRERLASLDPHFAQERLLIHEKQGEDGKGGVSVVLKIPFKNQFN